MNRTGNKCLANSGQWSFSKSFDTHCPLGPAIVHKDELGDASGLMVRMTLNGQVMQNESTTDMIFNVRKIVEFITKGTTVEAGTVIVSGTPGGVGYTRTPPVILQDGVHTPWESVLDAQALPSLAEQVWALHKEHTYVHVYLMLDTSTSGSLSAVSTPISASNIIV